MNQDVLGVTLRREVSFKQDVDAEIIGQWTPQEISQLMVIFDKGVAKASGRVDVKADDPVFWPPQVWAIEPRYDYYLVRARRPVVLR